MGEARCEKLQAQRLLAEEQSSDSEMRAQLRQEHQLVEDLTAELTAATEELKHQEDRTSRKDSSHLIRLVAKKDGRNHQLQNHMAQASLGIRSAESATAKLKDRSDWLQARLASEQEVHAEYMQLKAETEELRAETDALLAGEKQLVEEEHKRQREVVSELRSLIRLRDAAAMKSSEKELIAEVDAARLQIAQEAQWLEIETAVLPLRGAQSPQRTWQLAMSVSDLAPVNGEDPVAQISVKRAEAEALLTQLDHLTLGLQSKQRSLEEHEKVLREWKSVPGEATVNLAELEDAATARAPQLLAKVERSRLENERELRRVSRLRYYAEQEFADLTRRCAQIGARHREEQRIWGTRPPS